MYLSDDGGAHWYQSVNDGYRTFSDGSGFQEPGVVELNNGRVWCWFRCDEFYRQWQMFSEDGCLTWSNPEPSQFVSPRSPCR